MKTEPNETEETRLRLLLRQGRPAPPLPPRFEQSVWRRIQHAEAKGGLGGVIAWLDALVERLLSPRLAVAGVTALVVIGTVAGVISGLNSAKHVAQERYLTAVAPNPVR